MAMTQVNAAPVMPRNPYLILRDPEWSEAKGNLHSWAGVLIITHVLVFFGFLKLAEMYRPHLLPKPEVVCVMLKTVDLKGLSAGSGSASGSAGVQLKEHKSITPNLSAPRAQPTHQLKNAPQPTPTRISSILPTFNTPHPIWTTPEAVQQQSQKAPEAENNSVAGGVTSTKGNEGDITTGQEAGTGSQVGNGLAGNGPPGSGNIGPYRKYLLVRLSKKWHPSVTPVDVVLRLKISKSGDLISSEIYQSSGSPKADNEALKAANSIKYPPLPAWFGGRSLIFQIELASSGAKR
jgi:TonB family protein